MDAIRKVLVPTEVLIAERPGATPVLEIPGKPGCDRLVTGMHGRSRLTHPLFAA
jgi:hypothetical protein